jgi:hypothetical protein
LLSRSVQKKKGLELSYSSQGFKIHVGELKIVPSCLLAEPFEPLCASGAILSCHAFGLASARPAAFLPSRLNRCALQGSRTFKLGTLRYRHGLGPAFSGD